jgi:hypothetical protein
LEVKYKLKVETLSGDIGDVQEVRILNKIVRWTPSGVELEADPRHAELVIKALELENAKPCKTPGIKEESRDGETQDDELGKVEARNYRAIAARLNYLAPDRMDIAFAVKEAARNMSKPMRRDFEKLKRIGRYLLGRPRLVSLFKWSSSIDSITAFTDSDWAGCKATSKSTSGGIVTNGSHVLKSYSKQQRTVALSSAEAELHAMVAASAEILGIIGLLRDMGHEASGEVYCDASAAIGIAQRQGAGKLRHVRTQALWVQEVRAEGRLSYKKVLGSRNPSDALTKHMPGPLLDTHIATVGLEIRGGRADSAPTLNSVELYTEIDKTKKVRFHAIIGIRNIPSVGRCVPVTRSRKTRHPRLAAAAPGAVGEYGHLREQVGFAAGA